uniref:GATOR2 complex protein WDR24 n=1 Tax=Culicoides sonorensis TaxID=179676 RepID=A0A336LK17_CULSO
MTSDESTISIRICQEGHANAIALNKNRIAVAGRSLLKIFSVESDGFTEVCNMRGGKNQNLSYSSNDVAWSHIDDNLLATAATNGVVSVWDLSKFGRHKQTQVYNEHERTAHSVTFHPTDPSILISGSQDGTIKCFDLRSERAAATYISNSESIRDVKFHTHNPNMFAAVSENGSVSLWDLKRPDKTIQQFTAHSGPIYTCDFHQTQPWLATGSRDKTIKVWHIGAKPSLEYTIHTIAVVGRVKWRPEKVFHIASCALVVDYSVHIWDVRRPYIPYASFNEHTNVTTGIVFKSNDPNILLSTSKDSTIFKHNFKDASLPFLKANPQSTCLNIKGELLFAQRVNQQLDLVNVTPKGSPLIGKAVMDVNGLFHQTKSCLYRMINRPTNKDLSSEIGSLKDEIQLDQDYNVIGKCATEYLLEGNFQEVCEYNASVARRYGKRSSALLWQLVARLFKLYSKTSAGPFKKTTDHMIQSQNKTLSNPKPKLQLMEYERKDLNSMKEELIPLPIRSNYQISNDTHALSNSPELSNMDPVFGNTEINFDNLQCVKNFRRGFLYMGNWQHERNILTLGNDHSSPQYSSTKTESESDSLTLYDMPLQQLHINQSNESLYLWDIFEMIKNFMVSSVENGDIQMAVVLLLTMQDNSQELGIDEEQQEFWVLSYIELLQRYQLWNEAARVMNICQLPGVRETNQQSTSVLTGCGSCNKTLSNIPWYCEKCKSTEATKCAYCRLPVKGLYLWCQTCCHGGHVDHMMHWFTHNSKCPICGHLCEYD